MSPAVGAAAVPLSAILSAPPAPLFATFTTAALAPVEGGTKLTATYAVAGYLPGGMNTLASPVDAVIAEQFTRLKNYVLHGVASTK